MKDKYRWIDELDENNIKDLMNYKYEDYEINDELKAAVLHRLKSYSSRGEKKSFRFTDFFIQKRYFKYSFSFAVLMAVIAVSLVYFIPSFSSKQSLCSVIDIEGNAYSIRGDRKKVIIAGEKLKEKNEIATDSDSFVDIKIGPESFITVKEKSRIRFDKLYQDNELENTDIFLIEGEIKVDPDKITGESSFRINTELISTSVRGTSFTVSVDDDNNSKIEVYEGTVYVRFQFDKKFLSAMKPEKKEIKEKLVSILDAEVAVKKGESLKADYMRVKQVQKILDDAVAELNEGIARNVNEKIMEVGGEIDSLIDVNASDEKVINDDNTSDKDVKVEDDSVRLMGNLRINFAEKNNAVSSDGKNIYIASDTNKAAYSIDPEKAQMNWTFRNLELLKITGPVSVYHDTALIVSPEMIFFVDKKGNLISKEKIVKGPGYWSDPVISGDKIYIPGSESVYSYDGMSFDILENIPEGMGQIYLTSYNNDLLLLYSNDMDIKSYDLKEKKITWVSKKMNNRSFMSPLAIGSLIYIADDKGQIYWFTINEPSTMILKTEVGIISNITYANSKMYFVANDGYLCGVDHSLNFTRIKKADNNPEINKYLTKKLVEFDDVLYFCSDTGDLFSYDAKNAKGDFIDLGDNKSNNPLIGKPVIINGYIYVIDTASNIYRIKPVE